MKSHTNLTLPESGIIFGVFVLSLAFEANRGRTGGAGNGWIFTQFFHCGL